MNEYLVNENYINDMGLIPAAIVRVSTMETPQENYLWHINNMREHDGLKPFYKLEDIKFQRPVKFQIHKS